MAIKIPIVADVDRAVADVRKLPDAFEEVQDSLEDVAKEARKTEDALEEVGDGTKKAGDAADDMEKKFRDDFEKVRKSAKDSGDGIGQGFKDGTDRAGEGLDTFKDEADGTAREAAASFDGSAESIGDVFQELAANAFAGFGPAGAAAGIAVAAGLGVAISKLQEVADEINEAKEAGAEWAQSFNMADAEERIQALRDRFAELSSEIVDDRQWWELWQDEAVSALDAVIDAQDKAGTSASDFMRAFNQVDPGERLDSLKAYREELERQAEAFNESNQAAANRLDVPEARAWGEKRDSVNQLIEVLDDEIRKQEVANDVEAASAEAVKGTAIEIAEKNEAIEESNELLEENADANRKAFRAELDLADQIRETNATLKDSEASTNDKKNAVLDAIDAVVDLAQSEEDATGAVSDYNRVIERNKDQLYEQGRRAGITKREMDELIGSTKRVPTRVSTNVTDNGTADRTRRKLEDVLETAGVKKDMTVGVRANTTQANTDVANWRHAQQSIPVSIGLRAV